jgi:hypothetical protein
VRPLASPYLSIILTIVDLYIGYHGWNGLVAEAG